MLTREKGQVSFTSPRKIKNTRTISRIATYGVNNPGSSRTNDRPTNPTTHRQKKMAIRLNPISWRPMNNRAQNTS
jgi:hypothetical protein